MQLETGHEPETDFRDAFSRIIGASPSSAKTGQVNLLTADWIDTPLGPMVAIADEKALYLLEFIGRRNLEREIKSLQTKTRLAIVSGKTAPIDSVTKELSLYFAGKLQHFDTPIKTIGSAFQETVWSELQRIPLGQTRSYSEIAQAIHYPSAVRAVARANSTNQLALIIPCHRVINANGELGGYAGGTTKKQWLLLHERMYQ